MGMQPPVINPPTKRDIAEYMLEGYRRSKELGMKEKMDGAENLSNSTVRDYITLGKSRVDLLKPDGGDPMGDVSSASWNKTRASVQFYLMLRYALHFHRLLVAIPKNDMNRVYAAAMMCARILDVYEATLTAKRPVGDGSGGQSKRRSIPKYSDWQAIVYEAATPAQRAAIALLWATGCRPAEIERGVIVTLEDGALKVIIRGAKTSDKRGQPERVLTIDRNSEAGQALESAMKGLDKITIRRGASRLTKDFAGIREKTGLDVSPYSMRHQFAADMKAAGDRAQTARAMGHLSIDSQSAYGVAAQSKRRGGAVIDVEATREISGDASLPDWARMPSAYDF